MSTYIILEEELSKRNQFKKSVLTEEITQVTGCEEAEALELQKTHCNLLSFWAILFSQKYIDLSYKDFFKWCLDKKYLGTKDSAPAKGYINTDKGNIIRKLDLDVQIIKYKTFPNDRKPGEVYQVSINGNHHFLAAIITDDKNVDIFDTNDRGCPVEIGRGFARKHDRIDWVKFIG